MPTSSVRHNYPDIIPEPQINKKRELHMFFLKNRKRATAPKYEEVPIGEPTVPPFRFRCSMTFDGEDISVDCTESNKKESQHSCAEALLEKVEELKSRNPAPMEKFKVTLAAGMKVKVKQNVENYAGLTATLEKYLGAKEKWGMILANNKRIALHKDSFVAVGAATMYRTGLPVELLSVSTNNWLKGTVTAVKGEKISVRFTENGATRTDTFSPDDPRIRRAAVVAKRAGSIGNLGPLDIAALPSSFLDNEFNSILVQQLKTFGHAAPDSDFLKYVKVLLTNKNSQLQFKNDLQAFFGGQQKAEAFAGWIWAYLGEVIRRVKRQGANANVSTTTSTVGLRFINKKLGVDFRYGRNGWRITALSGSPAQSDLRVGDLVTNVAGQSIVGKAESEQIALFKNNLRDNVPLTITRKQTIGVVQAGVQYVNNALGIDFEYTNVGWKITNIGSTPGQPNLKVGDLVTAVEGNSLAGRGESQQAQIFKANLKNGAILTVQRVGVASNALPQLPPVNYGLPRQAISAIGGGTVRIRVLNSQIGIGFKYCGGGWQIVHLENRPGQPGLQIGDVVTHIGGDQISGQTKQRQMQIFAANIKNGCEVTVKRDGKTLSPEQMIIDFYPTIQADVGENAPPPCKIDTSLKGKIIAFSLKSEKFFAKIAQIRNTQDYPYQLQYIGSGQPSEYVHIDPDTMRVRDQNRHVLPFSFTTSGEVQSEQAIISTTTQRKSVFERQMGLFGGGGGGGAANTRRKPLLDSGVPSWWGNADRGKETFEKVFGRRVGGGGGGGGGRRGRSASPGFGRGSRRSGRGMAAGVSWSRSRSRSPARKRRQKGRKRFAAMDEDDSLDEFDDAAAMPRRGRKSRTSKKKGGKKKGSKTKRWDARKGAYVASTVAVAAESDSEMWDSDDTYEDY